MDGIDFRNCRECNERLPLSKFRRYPNGRYSYQCIEHLDSMYYREGSTVSGDSKQWTAHNRALMRMVPQDACSYCGGTDSLKLVNKELADRSVHIGWFCNLCKSFYPRSKAKARQHGLALELLPTIAEASYIHHECAVQGCERDDTQLHHWLPKHKAARDLCELYPQSYLCKTHHDEWHRLVTPDMYKRDGAPSHRVKMGGR